MVVLETLPAQAEHMATAYDPETCVDLQVERFAGVLLHPVVRTKMFEAVGLDQAGWKVVARWPANRRVFPVLTRGDRLTIAGQTYPILGVTEVPTCYLEIFVDAAPAQTAAGA